MRHKIAALILALAITASAQDSDWTKKYRTFGALNGRWWMNGLSRDLKYGFMMGFADGAFVMFDSQPSPKDNLEEAYRMLTPTGMTYPECVTALDNFFADPLNRSISIAGGLVVINRQHQGEDVSGLIRMFRKSSAMEVKP